MNLQKKTSRNACASSDSAVGDCQSSPGPFGAASGWRSPSPTKGRARQSVPWEQRVRRGLTPSAPPEENPPVRLRTQRVAEATQAHGEDGDSCPAARLCSRPGAGYATHIGSARRFATLGSGPPPDQPGDRWAFSMRRTSVPQHALRRCH